jgi:hypothetical protein
MIALILHNTNRYDRENNGLNLGPAGDLCRETFAKHGIDYDTEVFTTTADAFFKGDRPPGARLTKYIFAGQAALQYLPQVHGKTLDTARGVIQKSVNGVPFVVTYWPQDCVDTYNREAELEGLDDESDDDSDGDAKSSSPTKRSNYRFWFQRDIEKLLRPNYHEPSTILPAIYAHDTTSAMGAFEYPGPIFLDIECDPATNKLLCLALACGDGPVYSIPVYDWCGHLRVGVAFYTRLVREMRKRRVVIHNALFDLLFLATFYRLPFGSDIYCTMVAGHRIWPEAEKSLAHQLTLYANAPFHKDESGTFNPHNQKQYDQLKAYNVKDVEALRSIYYGQQRAIAGNEGLTNSVQQAMDSLYDYAFASLHGLEFNELKRQFIIKACEKRYRDLQRVLNVLVGRELNPGSPDQVVKYLHGAMGYRPEKTTDKGAPSVAGDALYKIKIKNPNNVAIDVIFEMRRMTKLKGMLGFESWLWEY